MVKEGKKASNRTFPSSPSRVPRPEVPSIYNGKRRKEGEKKKKMMTNNVNKKCTIKDE